MTGPDERVARFAALLEHAFTGEPPAEGVVDDVYRRAERLRRRRVRAVLAAGAAAVVAVATLGYGLTSVLLPANGPPRAVLPAGVVASAVAGPDPVLAVLAPAAEGLTVVPAQPGRGTGWRRYVVRDAGGRSRGVVEVSVHAAPDGMCFPVLADDQACARPDRTGAGVEYVRYTVDDDVDWQVTEVMARRPRDGRTVVVQATGERGTGAAGTGRPGLTPARAVEVAADDRVAAAFAPAETCTVPDADCPVLQVPVPPGG